MTEDNDNDETERTGITITRGLKDRMDTHRRSIPFTQSWEEYLNVLIEIAEDVEIENTEPGNVEYDA